jgi:hypothetical protein
MSDKKYIKALDIKEMEHIEPGHTIKIYGNETTVTGFYAAYNEGLEKFETIILTEGGGWPFERSLDVIEVLPDQPWNMPLQKNGAVWVRASEFNYEVGVAYHAKDSQSKGAGRFNKDGAFIWGDGTMTWPESRDDLMLLDESGQSKQRDKIDRDWITGALVKGKEGNKEREIAFAEWLNEGYICIEKKDGQNIYVEYGPQEYHRKQQYSLEQLWNEWNNQQKQIKE